MGSITPCLWFDGRAEEAAILYTFVVRNSRIVQVSRAGPSEDDPALAVSFELDGQPFVGLNGGPLYSFTEAVSFQIPCGGQEEVDRHWDALTDGGEAGRCGWLKDRFGVSWQIVPSALPSLIGGPDAKGAQRAVAAMLTMQKLDIAALEAAYLGA
ncbi:3-demethylubiquinone-9 3-methyltransferase [Arthrobacter sp. RIT-PI-e]|uniref:VOC family protein n=1 Tax=Arthrobacter sp. RIT-PI-e TaxID=1681197 RepID=UPI000676A739|nr:VOC family protein [Arthrobacter sp. RIT-PI-e]KNC17818.1 3-demethylubiquinone-9 3-methyltransferase [Arthrobacter sp. RIT-PI-e]